MNLFLKEQENELDIWNNKNKNKNDDNNNNNNNVKKKSVTLWMVIFWHYILTVDKKDLKQK